MNIRLIGLGILILLFIGGATTIFLQNKKINTLSAEREQLVQMASDSGRIAKTYINLHGREISRNNVQSLTLKNLRDLLANKEFADLDEFEALKKKNKNLDAIITIQADAIVKLKMKPRDTLVVISDSSGKKDSVLGKFFAYEDEYNQLNGLILPDSTTINAQVEVPIKGVIYWQRNHHFIFKNWRFGKKEYFSEMFSPNKWVHIAGQELIKIQKKP